MTVKSSILKGWGLGLSLGQHPEGHISYDDGHAAFVSQTAHFQFSLVLDFWSLLMSC